MLHMKELKTTETKILRMDSSRLKQKIKKYQPDGKKWWLNEKTMEGWSLRRV
jgi:hypothetical protein